MMGLATPAVVHGCTIRNESNDNVYVRIFYEPIRGQREIFERRIEFQLASGDQTYVDVVEFDKGSIQIREVIQMIEVTRTNGHKQEINAPFDNVNNIEFDWLFTIDNGNIRSVKQYT